MKKILIAVVLLKAAFHLEAQTTVKVPYAAVSIMIDGQFDPAEWKGARRLKLTDSLELYLLQDRKNIYWCLHGLYQTAVLGGVNFYLTCGDTLLNLHASAKLGERVLKSGSYGEWQWWNNRGWLANVARLDRVEERTFLRDEDKEFQLRKSRFKDRVLRVMLNVEYPQDLLPAWPAKAAPAHTRNWFTLEL